MRLSEGRAPLPTTLPGLFDFNQWNANQPGTTLFIPVTNTTLEYINLLFIYLSRSYGFSLVDETRGGRSAGLEDALASGRLDPARRMGIVELELIQALGPSALLELVEEEPSSPLVSELELTDTGAVVSIDLIDEDV